MTFKEFARMIEDFIRNRKRVTVYEILSRFSDVMDQNGFCLCDINDVLHNLEREGKIRLEGSTVYVR